ncbi:hypothetical protein A9Q99_09085 [Gammaproteobacteria bacterium 45_16_T64]|nr:hypothetical protein A9Q99_09085 [Gammaproteobacteria bacterium 45_16_T64]
MKRLPSMSQYFANLSRQQFTHFGVLTLILLLSVGCYFWLKSQMTLVHSVDNLGYKKEALLNPYLAAQTILNNTGLRTDVAVDIEVILNTVSNDDTIILLNNRQFHPIQAEKIFEWISNGGHLIMSPSSVWDTETESSDDEFLDSFGIRLHEWFAENEYWEEEVTAEVTDLIENYSDELVTEYSEEGTAPDSDDEDEEKEETLACTPYDSDAPSYITYDSDGHVISVNFRSRFHLEDVSGNALHAEALTDQDSANHILQYPTGEGMLTVLSDMRFWKNRQISWYDHSYLLWMLAGDSHTTWFIHDTDSPTLLSLLWDSAKYLIICLFTCLFLYLWQQGRRFGPIQPDRSMDRRQLIEHIHASTRFAWKQKHFEGNLTTLLHDIRQQLQLSHNIIIIDLVDVHSNADLIEKISLITELKVTDVQSAFTPTIEYKEHTMIQRIALLQQIRNRL